MLGSLLPGIAHCTAIFHKSTLHDKIVKKIEDNFGVGLSSQCVKSSGKSIYICTHCTVVKY